MRDSRYRALSGNSLVEYGFIAALIACACIGGLMALGKAMNQPMLLMKQDMTKQIKSASQYQQDRRKKAEAAAAKEAASASSGAGGGSACSATGKCMTIPPSVSSSAVTVGANGAKQSDKAADALSNLLAVLKSDPQANASLISLITKLANAGHNIADDESGLLNNRSGSSVPGQMKDLQGSISSFNSVLAQVNKQLAKDPAGMTPAMLKVLDQESGTILGISNNFKLNMSSQSWSYNGSNYSATQTHVSSNKVCSNGGSPPACTR